MLSGRRRSQQTVPLAITLTDKPVGPVWLFSVVAPASRVGCLLEDQSSTEESRVWWSFSETKEVVSMAISEIMSVLTPRELINAASGSGSNTVFRV